VGRSAVVPVFGSGCMGLMGLMGYRGYRDYRGIMGWVEGWRCHPRVESGSCRIGLKRLKRLNHTVDRMVAEDGPPSRA